MIFEGSLLLLSERTSSTAKKKVRDTPTWVQTRIFVPSTTSFKARVSFRQGAKRPWAHVSAKHPVISGTWLSAFVFPGQTLCTSFFKKYFFLLHNYKLGIESLCFHSCVVFRAPTLK
jgi:hypothetical protein